MYPKYKILFFDDWYVTAKKIDNSSIEILYQQDSESKAFEAILEDLKVDFKYSEMNREDAENAIDLGYVKEEDLEKYFNE